jgi:hypothetical protein
MIYFLFNSINQHFTTRHTGSEHYRIFNEVCKDKKDPLFRPEKVRAALMISVITELNIS